MIHRVAVLVCLAVCYSAPRLAAVRPQERTPSPTAAPEIVDTTYDSKLQAILDPHKAEWSRCMATAKESMLNATEVSNLIAKNKDYRKDKDYQRLTKEGDSLRKRVADCAKVREGIVAQLRKIGAPDAAVNRVWLAFARSLQEEKKE